MKIFLLYLAVFLAVLSSYPLRGELFCDADIWYYIATFNHYIELIKSYYSGGIAYNCMYPHPSPYMTGEPALGMLFLYLPGHFIFSNEVISYYFFTCLMLAINSFVMYLLSGFYLSGTKSRILAGFFFSFNSFIFSNIGSQNTIFVGLALLGIYYLKYALAENKPRHIIYFFLLSSAQLFFSAYIFMFQQLIAAIIIIGNFHAARQALKLNFKAIGQGTAALLASCLAFYFLFFVVNNKSGYYNFVHDEYLLKFCSINGLDLLRGGLLGKLIFHSPTPLKWMLDWHALSMGVVGFILILAGIYSPQLNYKKELLLILIITFFIGLGPYVQIFTFKIELPYGYVWNHSDILKFIRFPYRIFMITLVPIAIFMAHGFNRLWQVKLPTLPKQSWLLLIAIYAVENLPLFSLRGSETGAFITQSDKYLHFTKQLTGETILYLPTYNIVKPSYKDNSYMAIVPEYIYMYLQTKQPNNILNGCSGFYPPDRMKLNTSIDEFNNTGITTQLVDSFNFTYLVYYKKDPFNYINYDYRIKDLIANKKLQVVYNDSIQIVFKKQARLPA